MKTKVLGAVLMAMISAPQAWAQAPTVNDVFSVLINAGPNDAGNEVGTFIYAGAIQANKPETNLSVYILALRR